MRAYYVGVGWMSTRARTGVRLPFRGVVKVRANIGATDGPEHPGNLGGRANSVDQRKLGDDAKDPEWIATVHGVGYRFSSAKPERSLAATR